jgi:hypothetical protein
VTVYDAGTSDLSDIYSDQAGTAMANPFTLTATGRVTTGGLFLGGGTYDMTIKDSAGATVDFVEDVAGSITAGVTLTAGSVLFAGSTGAIAQDNANFFWDDTNNRLGLGDTSPGTILDIASTEPYITLHNTTETDASGGRSCYIWFEGEQSGGELSALGLIEVDHDGSSDDQKGKFTLYLNDGDDGFLPTTALSIGSQGATVFGAGKPLSTIELRSTTPYLTLKNDTQEDTEGGRESQLLFRGLQVSGLAHTLAKIQASHDGTSADQKGDLIFYTNDGTDNDSPTEAFRLDSAQLATFAGAVTVTGALTTSSMVGPLTITQNSDTLVLSHDGDDPYIKWTDGKLNFKTDDTDTITDVVIRGNGTGYGRLTLWNAGDTVRLLVSPIGNDVYFGTVGGSAGDLSFQNDAHANIRMFDAPSEGETRELKISGYRTSDALRTLEIGVGVDAADTASFDGLSNYQFDGNLVAAGGLSVQGASVLAAGDGYVDAATARSSAISVTGRHIITITPSGTSNDYFAIGNKVDGQMVVIQNLSASINAYVDADETNSMYIPPLETFVGFWDVTTDSWYGNIATSPQ